MISMDRYRFFNLNGYALCSDKCLILVIEDFFLIFNNIVPWGPGGPSFRFIWIRIKRTATRRLSLHYALDLNQRQSKINCPLDNSYILTNIH